MAAGQEDERPLGVVQARDASHPHAKVFAWPARARSTVEVKRDRYVLNLRRQYDQLKESLAAAERFFVVSQVGEPHLAAIRKAHAEALEDLSRRFQAKINEYDRRINQGARPAGQGAGPSGGGS